MSQNKTDPDRFVGLDVHKHYLIAVGATRGCLCGCGDRTVGTPPGVLPPVPYPDVRRR
jgi:hypothetical protein